MNEFIEKNRRLLKAYCITAQFFGWLVLGIAGAGALVHSLALASRIGDSEALRAYLASVPWGMLGFIPTGLVALGIAQFIRYLLESGRQPGWILRYGEQILYMYATFVIGYYIWGYIVESHYFSSLFDRLLSTLAFVLFPGAKVLVLVGLGQVLRRIMPVIEESKTLV